MRLIVAVIVRQVRDATILRVNEVQDDELELERDMEYFVEPEEALGPRTGDLGE